MLSLRAYAKHRAARGLPGATLSAVQRAIREGRIEPDSSGKVDPAAADEAWKANTRQSLAESRRQEAAAVPRPGQGAEFNAGAAWLAQKFIASARAEWPAFVAELNLGYFQEQDRLAARSVFLAVVMHLSEAWLSDFLQVDGLPAPDFSGFGPDAEQVRRDYEALRAEWGTPEAEEHASV